MATSWNSAYVTCPFYITDSGERISCEGIVGKASKVFHIFGSREAKERYMQCRCIDHHMSCEYCRALLLNKYRVQPNVGRFI